MNSARSTSFYIELAVAAVNDVAPQTTTFKVGGSIHHFTIKGTTCAEGQCEKLHDGRNPVDTGGGNNNDNLRCTESYTGTGPNTGTPGTQCGTANTCNPNHSLAQPGDGFSTSVVGLPNSPDYNGVWQVTRIVTSGQIKAKAPGSPTAINQHGFTGAATFSTGCVQ